jgi:glycosyltransferase involved in cell wall biosynthesis
MLKVTMWLVIPSFYQGDMLRALVAAGELDLDVIFARRISEDRIQLGWENDLEGYPFQFLSESNRIGNAMRLAWSQRDRIHIVNGMWMEPSFAAALATLAATRSTYAIYSEAPDPNATRSVAKKLFSTAFGRLIVGRASGYFPVARLGVEFFKRLGAREEKIYPYGYFRSHSKPFNSSASRDDSLWRNDEDRIEVVFVGQIVHRKGIDLLLEAMRPLFNEHPKLHLTVIGVGDLLERAQREVESFETKQRVSFEGASPSDEVLLRLKDADLLVLPSRWDGWGIVVNEAFAVGMPVVVSDRCGASELVHEGINGYVFCSGSVADLRKCLSEFIGRIADWPRFRENAAVVGQRISAEIVAPYVIDCLKHIAGISAVPPVPPWMELDVPRAGGECVLSPHSLNRRRI